MSIVRKRFYIGAAAVAIALWIARVVPIHHPQASTHSVPAATTNTTQQHFAPATTSPPAQNTLPSNQTVQTSGNCTTERSETGNDSDHSSAITVTCSSDSDTDSTDVSVDESSGQTGSAAASNNTSVHINIH